MTSTHTTEQRCTITRDFLSPAANPWERQHDNPNYQGRHRLEDATLPALVRQAQIVAEHFGLDAS